MLQFRGSGSMKLATRVNLPLVRTAGGRKTALIIMGFASVASFLQSIRRRRRKPDNVPVTRKSRPQALQAADTMRDWGNESPPIEPRSLEGEDLLLMDETVPLTPKQLWRLLYDLNFIQAFHKKRRNREVGIGCWQKTGAREFTKTAHYITPVKKNMIGPTEAYTEEEYTCQRRGESGFAVTVCAYTRKVPYGGSFHVELYWTAARVEQSKTRLQVVGRFVPEKRMLGVAGIIKKATHEGLRENYAAFQEHLWAAIRSGGVSRHAPKAVPSRTMSSAAKEAAEELINNGIFVSWGQLLTALLLIVCACVLARLAADREARALILLKWQQEWEPQLLGSTRNASAVVLASPSTMAVVPQPATMAVVPQHPAFIQT